MTFLDHSWAAAACLGLILTLGACAGAKPTPEIPPAPPRSNLPEQAKPWAALIERLVADGHDPKTVLELFAQPGLRFDPQPMRSKLKEYLNLYGSATTRQVQSALTRLGYSPGAVDGMAGDNTRKAIRAFQELHRLPADGEPTEALLAKLQAELALPEAQRIKPPPAPVAEAPEALPPVYKTKVKPKWILDAENFYRERKGLLQREEKEFGVPGAVVVGILTVETRLGTFLGKDKAFSILASMALSRDFSRIEPYLGDLNLDQDKRNWLKDKALDRGEWAYIELRGLLTYAKANRCNPQDIPGSIYGAIGYCQFMPSNVAKFGADGDGDGVINLFTMDDAVFSIGRYLRDNGWQGDMRSLNKQRAAIFRYNHSMSYANMVLGVARALAPLQ